MDFLLFGRVSPEKVIVSKENTSKNMITASEILTNNHSLIIGFKLHQETSNSFKVPHTFWIKQFVAVLSPVATATPKATAVSSCPTRHFVWRKLADKSFAVTGGGDGRGTTELPCKRKWEEMV